MGRAHLPERFVAVALEARLAEANDAEALGVLGQIEQEDERASFVLVQAELHCEVLHAEPVLLQLVDLQHADGVGGTVFPRAYDTNARDFTVLDDA